MFLESKESVLATLQRLTELQPAEKPLQIAVAYWGAGADAIIVPEKRYQIICSLIGGSTNPAVITTLRSMPNVEIRHLTELHAKVLIAENYAIVGSANISANGLGIGSAVGAGLLEAAAVIDAAETREWFDALWKNSSAVFDEDIACAAELWANRVNQTPAGSAAVAAREPPQLLETELFKSAITGGNKIRMAAKLIEKIYFQEVECESKRSVWNPAYAANLLWTAAGNRILTNIDGKPYFERPSDVLNKAKHPKTIEKVYIFLHILSKDQSVSPAIRYWANHCVNHRKGS